MVNNIFAIETGATVRGTYHGVAYRGVVLSQRSHTMNHRIQYFDVSLAAPITVYGEHRDAILVTASNDAAALARFLGVSLDQTPIEVVC